MIFVGIVIIPLVDRLERARLFSVILVVFALVLLGQGPLAVRAPAFVYRGLYIVCYLMKGLLFLQFWLLAGDLLDLRQAKRLFPILLGFSLVGGLTASITASILPRTISTTTLLAMAGWILLATLVPVMALARSRRGGSPERLSKDAFLSTVWRGLRADIRISWGSPLLRNLSLCLLLLALLAQVLDFLLGTAAHGVLEGNLDALTKFYAVLNGIVIGAGALVQFLFANRIVSTLGVTRAQLIAPLTFIGAFAVSGGVYLAFGETLTSFALLATVVASRAVQKVLRISLVRTSTDLIYNAIPGERRGRARALKETVIEPLGVLLSGAFLMAGSGLPLQFVLGTALLLAVLFLATATRLKDNYLESLVNVLKEKSRYRFAFPSVVMRNPRLRSVQDASVSGLKRALKNDEASVRLLAVEVASELKEPEAARLLVERFREERDEEVRGRMLSSLGKMLHASESSSEGDTLLDRDPRVRASGMESMAQSGIFRPEDLLEEDAVASAEGQDSEAPSRIQDRTRAGTRLDEKRASFVELARSGERHAFEQLVHYLEEGDGATRHLASRTLESCGEAAIDVLTLALWSSDVEGRRYVIRALDRIDTSRARQALLPVLMLEAEEAYYDLVRIEALSALGGNAAVALLRDSLRQRVDQARRNASQILRAVFIGEPGMRLILSNLNHPDRFIRASAIEALEVRVDPAMLGGVLPLFEHESPKTIAEHGSTYFDLPSRPPLDVLAELTRHRSAWIRACAVFALGLVGTRELVEKLEALTRDDDELTRLNAVEAIGKLGSRESLPFLERLASRTKGKLQGYAVAAIAAIDGRAGGAA